MGDASAAARPMFQEPAEVLLGRVMMPAFTRLEVGDGLVFHFEPFEMDDPDELIAVFPDLALLKFHL